MRSIPAPLHVLAPGAVGGLESVVRMLAEGQHARGYRVAAGLVVEEGSEPHPLGEALRGAGIAVHEVPVRARAYLEERRRVRRLCRDLGPTVVHTHGYRADVLAASAVRSEGLPVLSTVHGFTGGGLRNRLHERVQRRALRRADAVVAVSRPLAESLARSGVPADRIRLIPNGWSGRGSFSRPAARAELGLGPDDLVIGWVGRLSREKGADVLIAAVPALPRGVVISFLGDGRERPALHAQAVSLGVADRIRWHGAVPDAGRLMPAFDMFVLSSRTEGTPIALFEAMSARVPTVVTEVGGVPDVITSREGILVPPENPEALAAAILSALDDRDAARTRADAAAHRLEHVYSADAWLDRYDELYHSVHSEMTTP